jgi:hypothetical protein
MSHSHIASVGNGNEFVFQKRKKSIHGAVYRQPKYETHRNWSVPWNQHNKDKALLDLWICSSWSTVLGVTCIQSTLMNLNMPTSPSLNPTLTSTHIYHYDWRANNCILSAWPSAIPTQHTRPEAHYRLTNWRRTAGHTCRCPSSSKCIEQ